MSFIRRMFGFLIVITAAASFGVAALAGDPGEGFFNNADRAPLAELIGNARQSVQIEVYEMDDPAVIGALRAALQRGVSIHIVQEPKPLGSACRVFGDTGPDSPAQDGNQPPHAPGAVSCADQQAFVGAVNASKGGRYVPYRKEALCPSGSGCFEHGKIAVIDGSLALITTGNFNVSNLCDRAASPRQCDRDFSFVTRDPDVVTALSQIVEADARGNRYDVGQFLPAPVAAKLTVSPKSLDSLVAFLRSAQSSIQLENQYLKDPTLNQELVAAARRGVRVQVMVASECAFGPMKPSEQKKLTDIFTAFDGVGISSRFFTKNIHVGGFNGYLHAKAIVVDGTHAWLGSVNGSTEALTKNREFGIYFDGSSDVRGLAAIISADFSDPGSESWEEGIRCAEGR